MLFRWVLMGLKGRLRAGRFDVSRLLVNQVLKFGTIILCLLSCATQAEYLPSHTSVESVEGMKGLDSRNLKKIQVVTSIRPLTLWAQMLVPNNGRWAVEQLVKGYANPHDHTIRPSEVHLIDRADLFVWLGASGEPNLASLVDRFSSAQWRALQVEGFKPLYLRTLSKGDMISSADSESLNSKDKAIDPHIWASLSQTPRFLESLADALIALSPDDEPLVKKNLNFALTQIKKVQADMMGISKGWPDWAILSYHDQLQYLENDLKLRSLGFLVAEPDSPLSLRRLASIQQAAQTDELACVFIEPFSDRDALIKVFGEQANLVDLDLIGTSLPLGIDLIGYWQYIVEQFQSCFQTMPTVITNKGVTESEMF